MELPPDLENELPEHLQVLKTKLFSNDITPQDFLDKILALDQSNPMRSNAIANVTLMEQEELVNFFSSIPERVGFYNLRSLTYFHRAQIRLSEHESDVIADLERALQDSEQTGQEFNDWTNYIKATILYLQNNLVELRKYLEIFELNRELVANFIKGLESRGYPDYIADYSKPRD